MNIARIGVVGAGAMGTGISHVAAMKGFYVKVFDSFPGAAEKSLATIQRRSASSVEKGRETNDERKETLERIEYVDSLSEMQDVDIVIEAIAEILSSKLTLFKQLDELLPGQAMIVSNTSSMSITDLAASTSRADKVAGLHFFNPAQVMKLVEIVRGFHTSDQTVLILKELVASLGKTSIEIKRDTPGFVVNRLLLPQMREAIKLVEEGVASVEDIDTALKLGLNHPMGIFALQDLTGIDICYQVLEYFKDEMGDHYAPPLLMKQMVKAGRLGRKSGGGWYDYPPNES